VRRPEAARGFEQSARPGSSTEVRPPLRLFSADPGSSKKGWAVADCTFGDGPDVRTRRIDISHLGTVVAEVCSAAQESHVLLSLDAPVRVFGGLQAPSSFEPAGAAQCGRAWPFNVNPFSQRPCEHALSSKPTVVNSSLVAPELARAVAELCGWDAEFRKSGNRSFADFHEGVSVLGYMGAPHAPVVRTFLDAMAREATSAGVRIGYYPAPELREVGCITVLETHPAVALGFYAAQGAEGFPPPIPHYKPVPKYRNGLAALVPPVKEQFRVHHKVTRLQPIDTDDLLDALVGLLNLLDQANGVGDLFGTVGDGYFLLPPLVLLEDSTGDWFKYVDLVYAYFCGDFVRDRPTYRGTRLGLKRYSLTQGKEVTFWHMISAGKVESERTPELRRCERIRWPRPLIEQCQRDGVKVWEEERSASERRIHLWLEDHDYVVVLARRRAGTTHEYLLPWTAYVVDSGHSRKNLQRRFEKWA